MWLKDKSATDVDLSHICCGVFVPYSSDGVVFLLCNIWPAGTHTHAQNELT